MYRKAIDLQPGDVVNGPAIFVDRGTIKEITLVDRGVKVGVHVGYDDGTHVVRPESYLFSVVEPEPLTREDQRLDESGL